MMKKFNLAALVAVSMLGLVGCNGGTSSTSTKSQATEKVAAAVKDAMTLDRDALMKRLPKSLEQTSLRSLPSLPVVENPLP